MSDGSKLSNADSPGGGFKVPPLKIVSPITDGNMGTRTDGKNDNHSQHYIELPYVVSSEKTPPASNQPNSPKSPQNATPDIIAEEEQKSPQTGVLRSSNSCESNNCGTSSIVPDEQLAQTTSTAAMEVGAESSNPSLSAPRSGHTENASVIVSGDEKLAITTAAVTATTTATATPISTVAAIATTAINEVSKPNSNEDKSDSLKLSNDDNEQLAQTNSPAAMEVDAESSNPSLSATRSEHENASVIVSGDEKLAITTAAVTATTTATATPISTVAAIATTAINEVSKPNSNEDKSDSLKLSNDDNEQLAQTNSPAAMEVDAESSNPSLSATRSEHENTSVIVSGDEKLAITTAAVTETTTTTAKTAATVTATAFGKQSGIALHPKKRKFQAIYIEPQASGNSSTANVGTEDEKLATSTAAATVTATAFGKQSGIALHPKKRKFHAICTEPQMSGNVTTVETTNSSCTTAKPGSITNCYQMFLDIRKQVDKKRKNLFFVQPKPPCGFKDYLMNRCTYILAGNFNTHVESIPTPPPSHLHEQLKKLFVKQEKERQKLRVQHIVEKEKLVLSIEQEILRVHGRAARALTNQTLPFSACTILRDEEVYNILTPEQEKERDGRTRSRFNGRIFMKWLQEIDDKWENIKESLLLRHHNEAESLYAVQNMDWGWKLKELQLCTYSSEPKIDEEHVPMVLVCDDLNLPE